MIQVEQTPNPDSLKFLSQKILSRVGTEEFKKSNLNNIKIPFVKEVLNFSGVELVLISDNFLTVKKEKNKSFKNLKKKKRYLIIQKKIVFFCTAYQEEMKLRRKYF
mgnify:CR=1 FL=1